MYSHTPRSLKTLGVAVVTPLVMIGASLFGVASAQEHSTPEDSYSCATSSPVSGTPAMDHGGAAMDMSMEVEVDQLYIDMMLPHHGSIVALAEAALPELTDPRLQEMAQSIIDTQTAEQQELEQYREEWYGSAEPMALDQHMMDMMTIAMPSMESSMDTMMNQMSADYQVATFCAAEDPDLAFIDQTIPHHQMAIDASMDVLGKAVHPEIAEFAQKVIDAQQQEIDELTAIRAELKGESTPAT
jgi:uncharacterized protein (DUF305 family)